MTAKVIKQKKGITVIRVNYGVLLEITEGKQNTYQVKLQSGPSVMRGNYEDVLRDMEAVLEVMRKVEKEGVPQK